MEIMEFVLRALVAAGLGFLIGFERQYSNKSAGIRTNALVSLGSALFVLISVDLSGQGGVDATRVVGQIVTGIGFLGAGVIIHQGVSVQGLTTAATIWCSSAIGCLSATGRYREALIAAFMVIVINFFLLKVDMWVSRLHPRKEGENANGQEKTEG